MYRNGVSNMWNSITREINIDQIRKLLRKILVNGCVCESELKENELSILEKLRELNVIERAYVIKKEYISDVIKFLNLNIATYRKKKYNELLIYLPLIAILFLPVYITIYSIILGSFITFILFLTISGILTAIYMKFIVPRFRKYLMFKI